MRFCTLCRRAAPAGATICSYDGSPLTSDVVLEPGPGAEVGGYKLLDIVAHGECGTVYRAESTSSHNSLALKLLKEELSTTPSVMHRIRRETKNAVKLASANVVRVMDCGDHEGRFFIAREWVDGHPLSVAIREEGAIEFGRAAAVAYQVCAGLALIHRVGLVHRDLKPNHIVLVENEPGAWGVKLIDIGIADKVTDVESSREIYGTLAYLSPEQAEGKLVSFRSDLYSLGCVMYEMLAGRPPFSGDPQSIVDQQKGTEPPALESLRPDVPEALTQLVGKLLSKQASARPFSAAMVQRELERIVPTCKEPLAPVTTGKAPPQIAPAPAPASASASASAPAPAPAPPQQGDDFGMAQTLFGGPSPFAAPTASPAPPASSPAPAQAPFVAAAEPAAPPPMAATPVAATPVAASPAPLAQTPVIAAGEPAAPAPAAQPAPAPDPAPQQFAFQPGAGAASDGHKKTMLGFPVASVPGHPGTPGAAPGQQQAPAPQPGAAMAPGGQPQQQDAFAPQAQAWGDPAQGAPFQQAPVAPETTADLEMPKNDAARWILIILGILVGLGLLFGIASAVSYLACAGANPGGDDDGPPAIVELLGEDEHGA